MNMEGIPMSGARAMAQMSRGITLPSSYMACCGASDLSEASLTEVRGLPLIQRMNDRSRIMRNNQDLCGMAVIGLIFKLAGGLSLISFQDMIQQQPSEARSSASLWHAAAAYLKRCGLSNMYFSLLKL